MSNIYRALDYYEDCIFQIEGKLYCNSSFDGFYRVYNYDNILLSDNLDNIISHIQSGNNTSSGWISCSKDFIVDVEKYTVSNLQKYKKNRPNVAIVQNHYKSMFILKNDKTDIFELIRQLPLNSEMVERLKEPIKGFRRFPISKIEKLVIDADDDILLQKLFCFGFIQTKDGKIPNINSRAFNYARASSENLVLSSIEKDNNNLYKSNIPLILKPIEYDILYTLMKTGSIKTNLSAFEIACITNCLKKFPFSILNDKEKSFYRWYYSLNYTIEYILGCYDDERLDILSLYLELLNLKRSILKKIIDWLNKTYNENYSNLIYLIDDNSYVLRGKGSYQKINAELYDGTKIEVDPLDVMESQYLSEDITDKISFISNYEKDKELYTIIGGKVYRVPFYNQEKVKKYIREQNILYKDKNIPLTK